MGTEFKVDKIYEYGFIGDADLKVQIRIISKTKQFVTYSDIRSNETKRCKIYINSEGNEAISPLGKYSMSPVCNSDKIK